MVNGEWTSRIIEGTEDDSGMGRWSVIRLQGKGNRKLAIICGYRPVKTEMRTTGSSTVYRQQWNHMRALGNENPEPRSQFLKDLTKYIKSLRDDNHEILLMLDANESTGEKNSHINRFFTDCGLSDLHATKHRNLPDPSNTNMWGGVYRLHSRNNRNNHINGKSRYRSIQSNVSLRPSRLICRP